MKRLLLLLMVLSPFIGFSQSIVNKNKIVMQVANGDTVVQRIYADSNMIKSTQKLCIKADTITLQGYIKGVSSGGVDTSANALYPIVNKHSDTLTSHNTRINSRALKSTTLTINGTTQDLSLDRTWTISTAASAKWGEIQIKRKSKSDTIITNINLIGSRTLFPNSDSAYIIINKGNYVATRNIYRDGFTLNFQGGAKVTRTNAGSGICFCNIV